MKIADQRFALGERVDPSVGQRPGDQVEQSFAEDDIGTHAVAEEAIGPRSPRSVNVWGSGHRGCVKCGREAGRCLASLRKFLALRTAKFDQLLRGHWSCQGIALQQMAAKIFQDIGMLHRLHALGNNVDVL